MRFVVVVTLALSLFGFPAHAARELVKLDPPARDDVEARARVEAMGAELVRRSVLGWVVIEAKDASPGDKPRGSVSRSPIRRGFIHAAPNDALAADQWALDAIRAEAAWSISEGSGQTIGVVDTGLVRDHPDIVAVDGGGYDFVDDDDVSDSVRDDTPGRDADYADTAPDGPLSHGSHVAGIIAASTNNNVGIAGLNHDATIVSARAVAGAAGGTNIDIMEAAHWLAGGDVNNVPRIASPVDVINMSVGFEGGCDAFAQDIVDDILARGIPIVAAVGNHGALFGRDSATVLSPADCAGVIAVGAVDDAGVLTEYTNNEGVIDVVAPGGTSANAILSLGANGDYVGQMGTSMATPHVAGVVSLMRAVDPTLTPVDIEAMLVGLAADASCTGCNGAALLDAAAALEAAQTGRTEAAGGCASSPIAPLPIVVLAQLLVVGRRARWVRRSGRTENFANADVAMPGGGGGGGGGRGRGRGRGVIVTRGVGTCSITGEVAPDPTGQGTCPP